MRDPNEHLAFGEDSLLYWRAAGADGSGDRVPAMLERFPRMRLRDPGAKLNYKGSILPSRARLRSLRR